MKCADWHISTTEWTSNIGAIAISLRDGFSGPILLLKYEKKCNWKSKFAKISLGIEILNKIHWNQRHEAIFFFSFVHFIKIVQWIECKSKTCLTYKCDCLRLMRRVCIVNEINSVWNDKIERLVSRHWRSDRRTSIYKLLSSIKSILERKNRWQ